MPDTAVLRTRPVRPNRIADLVYLTVTLLAQAAVYQVWMFAVGKTFWSGGAGAMAAAALFPMATLPLYTRLALGPGHAVIMALASAVVLYPAPQTLPLFAIQAMAAGLAGGYVMRSPSKRGAVVTSGAVAGLASAVVLMATAAWSFPATTLLTAAAFSVLGGVLAGAAVLALSPAAERIFGHVTSLTLLEALSYDHPLLSRLVTTAPGTFLHSTNVAVMCDAGARAIGADPLTTRVAALYHDAGKTIAPERFVENHTHDLGDDMTPEATRDALLAHVTDGVRLVQAHGLGRRIAAFVGEHHGTTEMRSLLDRAEREGRSDPKSYRYPGPRPRSRESGMLMIADRLEAIARARRPATLDACLTLAREVVDQIVAEEQLVHSGLSDQDLDTLEQSLAEVLHAVHHQRVGYREAAYTPARLRAVAGGHR